MLRAALLAGMFGATLSIYAAVSESPTPSSRKHDQPCASPEYSQFDFWLGDWDSYDAAGTKQGQSLVRKVLGGCAIQEWWAGTDGAVGSSFTIFDVTRGIWNQTWVSNHGTLLPLEGYKQGASIVLIGLHKGDNGKIELNRTTWTPLDKGRVHQLWDISTDGGKTWAVNYEGFLKPAVTPFDTNIMYRGLPGH